MYDSNMQKSLFYMVDFFITSFLIVLFGEMFQLIIIWYLNASVILISYNTVSMNNIWSKLNGAKMWINALLKCARDRVHKFTSSPGNSSHEPHRDTAFKSLVLS